MRNVMSSQAQRNCYQAGREARDLDKDKSPPGGLGAQRRSWWIAGYNDRDIELQVLARNQRKGQTEMLQEIAISNVEGLEDGRYTCTRSLSGPDFSIIGIEKMPPMEYDEP